MIFNFDKPKSIVLNEGGKAIKSSEPIRGDLALSVANQVISILKNQYGQTQFAPLGSTGKKGKDQTSGDIDIAVELDYSEAQNVEQLLKKTYPNMEVNYLKGFHILSIGFPYKTPENEDKIVQCDLMFFPNIELAKYFYWSPDFTKGESKFKGSIRNMLMLNILKNIPIDGKQNTTFDNGDTKDLYKYSFQPDKGLVILHQSYEGKKGQEIKTKHTIKDDTQLVNNGTNTQYVTELMMGKDANFSTISSFENMVNWMMSDKFPYKDQLNKIWDDFYEYVERQEPNTLQSVKDYISNASGNVSESHRKTLREKLFESVSKNIGQADTQAVTQDSDTAVVCPEDWKDFRGRLENIIRPILKSYNKESDIQIQMNSEEFTSASYYNYFIFFDETIKRDKTWRITIEIWDSKDLLGIYDDWYQEMPKLNTTDKGIIVMAKLEDISYIPNSSKQKTAYIDNNFNIIDYGKNEKFFIIPYSKITPDFYIKLVNFLKFVHKKIGMMRYYEEKFLFNSFLKKMLIEFKLRGLNESVGNNIKKVSKETMSSKADREILWHVGDLYPNDNDPWGMIVDNTDGITIMSLKFMNRKGKPSKVAPYISWYNMNAYVKEYFPVNAPETIGKWKCGDVGDYLTIIKNDEKYGLSEKLKNLNLEPVNKYWWWTSDVALSSPYTIAMHDDDMKWYKKGRTQLSEKKDMSAVRPIMKLGSVNESVGNNIKKTNHIDFDKKADTALSPYKVGDCWPNNKHPQGVVYKVENSKVHILSLIFMHRDGATQLYGNNPYGSKLRYNECVKKIKSFSVYPKEIKEPIMSFMKPEEKAAIMCSRKYEGQWKIPEINDCQDIVENFKIVQDKLYTLAEQGFRVAVLSSFWWSKKTPYNALDVAAFDMSDAPNINGDVFLGQVWDASKSARYYCRPILKVDMFAEINESVGRNLKNVNKEDVTSKADKFLIDENDLIKLIKEKVTPYWNELYERYEYYIKTGKMQHNGIKRKFFVPLSENAQGWNQDLGKVVNAIVGVYYEEYTKGKRKKLTGVSLRFHTYPDMMWGAFRYEKIKSAYSPEVYNELLYNLFEEITKW